jgi:hypothetical protein
MRRIELPARWATTATTTRLSTRLHPPSRAAPAAWCIREVLTLRLPRCERGALLLSDGSPTLRAGGRARTGSVGIKSPGPVPSGATSAGRPAPCRTRPSAVSERRRHRLTPGRSDRWTQGVSEARPPACRAGALPLSSVSAVVMGGFDPPPRVFQTRALPTELHDHGAGPGTRTRIDWVTKPAPVLPGPAGTCGTAWLTPRRQDRRTRRGRTA